ncbi:SPOR domain-containing protein [Geoalkalibacter halelectricus]|uniref:SPOR domain-containing protein n=1 Tax=Geoalkalibacter halelectricus TaxID=2847045 RepID=A0ABY5ZIQ2_9BACT|nr:SPOR domain-containing protein [Geoalkalibacter halelectricus]MDO3379120.1 SPOR domain-containing protein [Geoalkalibacter halelectricus]UWZ79006.1 SPOR domain-containing protein [Geoalkalibacter halelectricus]
MNRDVKSRSQRRMEKKQALLLLVLMLAVSLVSFSLGVMVGKSGSSEPAIPAAKSETERIQVVQQDRPAVPAPAAPPAAAPPAETEAEKQPLTFFDTLPRGQEPPLGTGINLPRPAQDQAEPAREERRTPPPEARSAAPAAPAPAPAPSVADAPRATSDGRFVVQVGSFRSPDDARVLSDRLKAKNYPVFVQQADLGERGTWYRVRLGPYAQSAEAQGVVARLKSEEKIDAFVANR